MITRSEAPEYVWGAAVAAWCLRKHSDREIHFMVTEAVDESARKFLAQVGTGLIETKLVRMPGSVTDRFRDNYTKLRIFDLTQFERVVYLDADVMPILPLDDLFEMSDLPTAAEDPGRGRANYFNSGVLSLKPDNELYNRMLSACRRDPHDWGCAEQDFLNWWFGPAPRWIRPERLRNLIGRYMHKRWQTIPYEYNAIHLADHISKGYDPVGVRLVHEKLWEQNGLPEFEQRWWEKRAELTRALKARDGYILSD